MKCETAALQDVQEMQAFISILRAEKIRSYLEIGSKFGGSFWHIGNSLPRGSRLVSVDLPKGDGSWKNTEPALIECVDALCKAGYDAHLILGDSVDPSTVEKVRALGPFDACFIDGNHVLPYVTSDWINYGPMARIVGFHDIAWKRGPEFTGSRLGVPEVWKDLKATHRHREILLNKNKWDLGIGVLWNN